MAGVPRPVQGGEPRGGDCLGGAVAAGEAEGGGKEQVRPQRHEEGPGELLQLLRQGWG